jgi:fructuronate reductase
MSLEMRESNVSDRLRAQSLGSSPARRPGYDRARLTPGIVHLGLGAFFRAHGAEYIDDVLEKTFGTSGNSWGVIGASLQRPDQRDKLKPQDCLYTLIERAPEGDKARIIGSLLDAVVAKENSEVLLRHMADPAIRIVSLTITEKGYCHDPATGKLDPKHPDIVHDTANLAAPRSAIGFIVEALRRRRDAGVAPFTVLCCDNLPSNGKLLSGFVTDFARLRDDMLASWIARNAAFPSTMVDRIVPAATPADLESARKLIGLVDEAAVAHEPFRQWVIEDTFVGGTRPAWEQAGAQFVAEVAPFENMKLKLLNASHSALAYLGYLAGHETITDTVSDPVFRRYVQRLWNREIIPVFPVTPGMDLDAYVAALLARYSNPSIRHRTWQIAMDGSQKLPQRLLGTIRTRLKAGLPLPMLALAVAAWMRYVGGIDEKGAPIDVRDPLAKTLRDKLDTARSDPDTRVAALLGVTAVFGDDLSGDANFRKAVTSAYAALLTRGSRPATESLIGAA